MPVPTLQRNHCLSFRAAPHLTPEHDDLGQLDRVRADRVEHILQLVHNRYEGFHLFACLPFFPARAHSHSQSPMVPSDGGTLPPASREDEKQKFALYRKCSFSRGCVFANPGDGAFRQVDYTSGMNAHTTINKFFTLFQAEKSRIKNCTASKFRPVFACLRSSITLALSTVKSFFFAWPAFSVTRTQSSATKRDNCQKGALLVSYPSILTGSRVKFVPVSGNWVLP